MNCIELICLYLKEYLTDAQFEKIFSDNMDDFQNCIGEELYLDILFTNFNDKQDRISLHTKLCAYVKTKYLSLYESISDSYVERIIDSDDQNVIKRVLGKRYEKIEKIEVDCSLINTSTELMSAIKLALKYPEFCGNNWDAIEDLIYDVIFPKELVLLNWSIVERKIPYDAAILKKLLKKYGNKRCLVRYF